MSERIMDMATKKKRASKSGITAKLKPSAALAAITGAAPVSRGQVMKKVWAYIKRHKLQSPRNARNIRPDAKLAKVIGSAEISMFSMAGRISKHLS